MTLSKRSKIIITVAVVIFVLLIIFGLIWYLRGRGPSGVPTNTNEPFSPERLPVVNTNATPSLVKEPALEASLKTIAITFAERYGSYSNEGNFENLTDLKSLMTVKMKGTVDSFMAQQRALDTSDNSYYGITTQVLVATITAFDESLGRAEITLNTQRQESKGNTVNPRVFYQKIVLKLVKTNEGWKVDETAWQ